MLLSRTKYYAHRVVWLLHYGEWPKGIIDHIDGDKSNNRVSNLREVTKSLNARNMKRQKSNKSGMNGVSRHALTGKWRARIEVERVTICLGLYDNFDDACEARKAANLRHGFSERHGA